MTVKELEQRTGMTRANIRYYEQEGLLSPARKENGYRSYSHEDGDTLLKIKLLRQLQFSLQEIKALQRGELSLSAAMEARRIRLDEDSAALLNARDVCRAIAQEVSDYAALDPELYLGRLANPGDTVRTDVAEVHPWRRFFARSLDLTLAGIPVSLVCYLLLRQSVELSSASNFLRLILSCMVVLAVEPFFLHFWGTTPGKWVFGIQVFDLNTGGNLSLSDALWRTGMVTAYGDGVYIPILSQILNGYSCYRYAWKGEPLAWEKDNAQRFTLRGWQSAAGFLALSLLAAAINYSASVYPILPPNRGELTVVQFCENYNYYRDMLGIYSSLWLDAEGRWQDHPDTPQEKIITTYGKQAQPDLVFTTRDGILREISYVYTLKWDTNVFSLDTTTSQLCWMAAAAAQKGTWLSSLRDRDFLLDGFDAAAPWREQWQTAKIDYRPELTFSENGWTVLKGSTITCTISLTGT